jgi:plasmid stabilization system protein ParE
MGAEKKITKAEARTLVAAIETSLRNGCKPPDIGTVGRERSAVSQTAILLASIV